MRLPVRRLAARRLAALAAAVALWAWPVAAPHPIARAYIAPAAPYAAGHRGIDIRATEGTEVRAPADGVVHFAGVVVDRPVLSIDHGGGVLSSYEPVETTLHEGEVVRRGQVIGVLRAGHCASGACLHFGVRIDGDYVSPLLFLGGQPRAVLLPP
jgi:murein DD-endopeptidase MepM/ murein hydrolase activator NlpD